jgi:hypothetical protein
MNTIYEYKVTIYKGNEIVDEVYFRTINECDSYINRNVDSNCEAFIDRVVKCQ